MYTGIIKSLLVFSFLLLADVGLGEAALQLPEVPIASSPELRVVFRLSARLTPPSNIDPFNGYPDPYVRVYESRGDTWTFVMQTEPVIDNNNPNWMETVRSRVHLNSGQKWRFEVMDYDPVGPHDFLGQVVVPVEEYLNRTTTADFMTKSITPSGAGTLVLYKYQ